MHLSSVTEIDTALQRLCCQQGVLALALQEEFLLVATTEAVNSQVDAILRLACGKQIKREIWSSEVLRRQLHQLQEGSGANSHVESSAKKTELAVVKPRYLDREKSVVGFINQIIGTALEQSASDIHFEPFSHYYQIRLRIDGVLQHLVYPSLSLAKQIVSRLKIMSQLNIAECRHPQDGKLTITLAEKQYTMRLSLLATAHGEKAVLRLQENRSSPLSLGELGLSVEQSKIYQQALRQPQGLILVTGPTGSGKTATLYSGLQLLNQLERNICSVEDPIEMLIDGINQTQINTKINLTFSRVLRALLRQDPDVIMVGEIRDHDTAAIAVTAAQTGHLVLSTLHTNSACETVLRLQQMGIAPYLLASSLQLVIAQRLVRRLCPHCRAPADISSHLLPAEWRKKLSAWQGKGCQHCHNGYQGRLALYEYLPITPAIKQLLLSGSTLQQLQAAAQEQELSSLLDTGLQMVQQGVTSLDEIYRVLGVPV